MKKLRIGLLLLGLVLLGQLPVSGFNRLNEQQTTSPKILQSDTVRMTWSVSSFSRSRSFYFQGEQGGIYNVIWGDGQTSTEIGKGPDTIRCIHTYEFEGEYEVLFFGVREDKK